MHLLTGTALQEGKYEISGVLGQGGFGITYLAEDTVLRRQVAIKEFFPKEYCCRSTDGTVTLGVENTRPTVEKLRKRFLSEARNVGSLNHDGIVQVSEVFEENATAYYVMDFINGDNLSDMIKEKGALNIEQAVRYIKLIGEALTFIHNRGMTHFDVKPANIVVEKESDRPILIDFGLSKQYDQEGESTSTLLQAYSRGFSPYEMYSGDFQKFSPRTDVYSLAATFYYLLTNQIPSEATALIENELTFPSDFPNEFKPVLKKAMAWQRKDRYADVSSFIEALDKAASKMKASKRLSTRAVILIVTIILGFAVAVGFLLFEDGKEPQNTMQDNTDWSGLIDDIKQL